MRTAESSEARPRIGRVKARGLPALLLIAILAIGGCGGSSRMSKSAYAAKIKPIVQSYGTTLEGLGSQFSSLHSTADFAGPFTSARDSSNQAAAQIAKLKPPSDIQAANDQLVTSLHELAGDFGNAATAAKGGNLNKVKDVASGLANQSSKAIQDFKSAAMAVQAKIGG